MYLATYAYKDGKRVSSEDKSEKGQVNKLLDNYSLVLTDFTNIAETRASIDTLTKILQRDILPIVQPKSIVEANPMYELSPYFQLMRKTEYTGGKAGIAPFALNSTNHALTQFTHLCLRYAYGNRYNLGGFDEIKGLDDQNIMDWLSALINAHVDVAKDPYIMALNVNQITYNMTSLLIRGGKGESTFYFLAQPALRRFTKEMLDNNGVIGVAEKVDEWSKLNELLNVYFRAFGNAIVTETDANKRLKYAEYYNNIAERYSQLRLEGYGSTQYKYSDVFDKAIASNALKNPKSIEGLYQQVISVIAYMDMYDDTKLMGQLVQLSQIDTKKFGNDLPLQLNFKRRLDRFIQNSGGRFYINGREDIDKPIEHYLSTTFLERKLNAGILMPRQLLKNQVIEATNGYRTIFNAACDFFLGNSSSKEAVGLLSNLITTILRAKAVANNIEDFQLDDDTFLQLLLGEKSMVRHLAYIKKYLQSKTNLPALVNNGIIKNELLNYLQEYTANSDTQRFDRIATVNNAMTNTFTYENRLLSAYQDLLDCEDQIVRNFANRLGVYAFMTSYDNRGTDSFFDVITTAWKRSKGYSDVIQSALDVLNQDSLNSMNYFGYEASRIADGNYTEIFTDIARNAVWNNTIIKPRNMRDSAHIYKRFKHPVTNRIAPVVFSEYGNGDNFIKIQIDPLDPSTVLMYQKIGTTFEIDSEGERVKKSTHSIYKILPTFGTKDGRKIYNEYHKLPQEQSAFDTNALPKDAIITNLGVETMVIQQSSPFAKKKGNILIYSSNDAIFVRAAAAVAPIVHESVELQGYGSANEAQMITVGEETDSNQGNQVFGEIETGIAFGLEDANFSDESFGDADIYFEPIMDVGIYDNLITLDTEDVNERIVDMQQPTESQQEYDPLFKEYCATKK